MSECVLLGSAYVLHGQSPAGNAACGLSALVGAMCILVATPLTWIGTWLTCRSLQWIINKLKANTVNGQDA